MQPHEVVSIYLHQALPTLLDECHALRQGLDRDTYNDERRVICVEAPCFAPDMLGKNLPCFWFGHRRDYAFVVWKNRLVKLGSWEWKLVY